MPYCKKVLNVYSKKVFTEIANQCGFLLISNKQLLPYRHYYLRSSENEQTHLRVDIYQREDTKIIFHFVLDINGNEVSEWYVFVRHFAGFNFPTSVIYSTDDYKILSENIRTNFRTAIIQYTINKLGNKILERN